MNNTANNSSNNSVNVNNLNEDVIPKLKFISKLNKGDKINVKNLYIQPNSLYSKIIRSFFEIDDRTNTLTFVSNTVKKGFELFQMYAESKNPYDLIVSQNIISDLKNAKNGLTNLKETYHSDVMFICKIDSLIEEIDAKIVEIEYRQDKKEVKDDVKEYVKDEVKDEERKPKIKK